ncbi:hypothetical protein ACJMK2_041787 [Sinanodonta woodiana]|uniref:Uncharacterized protein n=1 Tax=Sinanodonta woodiana TaxID=1069815 RepID=A0ABD3W5A7_SINWO
MDTCCSCNQSFEKKPDDRGYYRFFKNWLQIHLPKFTPRFTSSKCRENFLSTKCWSALNETVKYQNALRNFRVGQIHKPILGRKEDSVDRLLKRNHIIQVHL